MSKFCGYCGTVLNDSETFCSNCGASFNGQVQQINKKKHTRIILLCSLVVALICIGIAVYFIFFKPTIIGKWESIDYTQTNHTYNSNVYLSVEFTSDNRFIMKDNTNKKLYGYYKTDGDTLYMGTKGPASNLESHYTSLGIICKLTSDELVVDFRNSNGELTTLRRVE